MLTCLLNLQILAQNDSFSILAYFDGHRANTVVMTPSHLDLQCLQIQLLLCLVLYGLTDNFACSLYKNHVW